MHYIVESPIYEPAGESETARSAVLELKKFLVENNFDCVIFLGNGAIPAMWGLEILSEKMDLDLPKMVILNTGKSNFREKYMYNTGEAINEDGTRTFVGEADTEENIELFCSRVREDKKMMLQARNVLVEQVGEQELSRRVLIVDDMAFEGVQKLFAQTVIDELFSPQELEYYECNMVFDEKYKQGLGVSKDFELNISDELSVKESKKLLEDGLER